MKKIIATITIGLIAGQFSLGQVNRYYQPATYTPINTYVSPDYDALYQIGAAMQARYNNNRDHRDKLIDWIFDLKTKTNDQEFLDAMDYNYKKLRAMDDQDFGSLGSTLNSIEQDIKEEIDKCNTRTRELPGKLWDAGNENLKNGNYADAVKNYSALIQIDPSYIYTYRNRGFAYYSLNKLSNCIADLNKYIAEVTDDQYSYATRGWAKYYTNDYTGALADFNLQIENAPNSAVAYYNRGSAKSMLNDNYGAITDYSKAIQFDPSFSMAYNNRGWSKYELKKYSEALVDLNKAIELDPKNWVAYDSRQETKFALLDYKGCIDDCNKGIAINSKLANSYFFRGRAYYKQGLKTKACEDWSKAGELGKSEAYEYITKYCNN